MSSSSDLDYLEEYGEGGSYRLQPTQLPMECNFSAGSALHENVATVRFLYQHGLIYWPNFTNCLPNCGLCSQFASDHTYLIYNLVVIGLLLPFVSLCGLCGNIVSAFVYSRPALRHSQSGSLYLSALGFSDTAVIMTALFLFFIDSIRRYSLHLSIIYGSLSPIVYPAGMIAQTCSIYFTLAAGIDCFVQVCMPPKAKRLFGNPRFIKAAVGAILLFAFLYNIPHCFESVLLDCWHPSFDSQSVEVCPAPLRFQASYVLVYYKYMYAIFLAVGPLFVLIALNTVVVVATVFCKKGNPADNMALILVVLLFILCNTIALLINIFETYLSNALSWRINYIIDISNLLVVFNSSFNFIIYYNFSLPFRSTFLKHICCSHAMDKSPALSRNSSAIKKWTIGTTEINCAGPKAPLIVSVSSSSNSNGDAKKINVQQQHFLKNGGIDETKIVGGKSTKNGHAGGRSGIRATGNGGWEKGAAAEERQLLGRQNEKADCESGSRESAGDCVWERMERERGDERRQEECVWQRTSVEGEGRRAEDGSRTGRALLSPTGTRPARTDPPEEEEEPLESSSTSAGACSIVIV